ncbi:MAG: hypothetical protein MZV70_37045 [Desulfobacterales bacterium]|nr:hypothetical protein [Desulfobacterales bacterium]
MTRPGRIASEGHRGHGVQVTVHAEVEDRLREVMGIIEEAREGARLRLSPWAGHGGTGISAGYRQALHHEKRAGHP